MAKGETGEKRQQEEEQEEVEREGEKEEEEEQEAAPSRKRIQKQRVPSVVTLNTITSEATRKPTRRTPALRPRKEEGRESVGEALSAEAGTSTGSVEEIVEVTTAVAADTSKKKGEHRILEDAKKLA